MDYKIVCRLKCTRFCYIYFYAGVTSNHCWMFYYDWHGITQMSVLYRTLFFVQTTYYFVINWTFPVKLLDLLRLRNMYLPLGEVDRATLSTKIVRLPNSPKCTFNKTANVSLKWIKRPTNTLYCDGLCCSVVHTCYSITPKRLLNTFERIVYM